MNRQQLSQKLLEDMIKAGLADRTDNGVRWNAYGRDHLSNMGSPRDYARNLADGIVTVYGVNVQISTAAASAAQSDPEAASDGRPG